MNMNWKAISAAALAAIALTIPACSSQTVDGHAVADPSVKLASGSSESVASTNAPQAPAEDKFANVPAQYRSYAEALGQYAPKIRAYWKAQGVNVDDVRVNLQWDSATGSGCGSADTMTACSGQKVNVGLPYILKSEMPPAAVGRMYDDGRLLYAVRGLAHEFGHIVTYRKGDHTAGNDEELHADCLAGMFLGSVAQDDNMPSDVMNEYMTQLYPGGLVNRAKAVMAGFNGASYAQCIAITDN